MNHDLIIANRYVIQRALGEGGMGTVWLATDNQTNLSVAIKQLKSELARPELIERFRREGEALRDLNHPNIVKLLDALEDAGHYYLVMEYVTGGDLAKLISRSSISYEQTLRYLLDLADALTRAHKLNIIHRDLKPANILIADDGTLRLTDFGIAQLGRKKRVTETDAIVGTVDYLPPEAFDGSKIDTRADIWAFGVILFEMLTGQRPFAADTLMATIHNIVAAPIPDLETLSPNAPIELIDLVYRMLERDPQVRIASIRHVGAALEDILHGRKAQQPITRRFNTPPQDLVMAAKHNLPAQTTPFVGRDAEREAVIQLLNHSANRLITILAPGGMGKTRLSLAVGEHMLKSYPDGVYFVELAPLSEADNIIKTIVDTVGHQLQGDDPTPLEQVTEFLSDRKMLLILDNYEHLMAGASLTTALLKGAPDLNIIATSRQRLNQMGETIYNLTGMDFPEWETPDDALEYGAVQLFLQSARRIRPDFELNADNLDAVARICKLVQGMPLGILLAASWLGMLSPDEIAHELASDIDFLQSDSSDLPERQRSIRAVFDYSWQHMTDQEQNVFMRLSVFRGGFTREAAQAVADANLRDLMSLINKSLLRRDAKTGRYDIHELLRQYAEDHLNQQQLTQLVMTAHAQYFVALSEQAEFELRYANQEHWFRTLSAEHDNIRVALTWSLEHQLEDAYRIMVSSRDFWFYQGHHVEGYMWMSKIRKQSDKLDDTCKGRLFYSMSILAWAQQKTDEAEQLARQSYDLLKDSENKYYRGWMLIVLVSIIGIKEGQYEEAIQLSEQARQAFLDIDDKAGLAQLYNSIGNAHEVAQQNDLAVAAFEQSLATSQETGEKRRIAMNQGNLARMYIARGEYVAGLELLKQTMKLDYQIGFKYMLIFDLNGFAELLSKVDRLYDALIMLSASAMLSEILGIKVQPADYTMWKQTSDHVRAKLDDEQYEQAWQIGQKMTFDEAMDFALQIEIVD